MASASSFWGGADPFPFFLPFDAASDLEFIHERLSPWARRTVVFPGGSPEMYQAFVYEIARSIDEPLRALAAKHRLRIRGFPTELVPVPKIPKRAPPLGTWEAKRNLAMRFHVQMNQVLPQVTALELNARVSSPMVTMVAIAFAAALQGLFWPPPNVFAPWHPAWIAAFFVSAALSMVYLVRLFGIGALKLAAMGGAGIGLSLYLFWPAWIGAVGGAVAMSFALEARGGAELRGELAAALAHADEVPPRFTFKRAWVAPPATPVEPAAPMVPSSCPMCGAVVVGAPRACPNCGFRA